MIEDSVFEYATCSGWGGTVILDGDSHATFNRVRFSNSVCPYGGILDDGGTSAAVFDGCTFEYGSGIYGAAYYGYPSTRMRFLNSLFQHNVATNGAVFISNGAVPYFENVTFFNNTGLTEAAVLFCGNDGSFGQVIFKNVTFLKNTVAKGGRGVIEAQNNVQFDMCTFEGNDGANSGGAMMLSSQWGNNTESIPMIISNSRFIGNTAVSGGAIYLDALNVNSQQPQPTLIIENTVFLNNRASSSDAAAIHHEGSHTLIMRNVTFRGNVAYGNGGALQIIGRSGLPTLTEINDSVFEENLAFADGGAVQCTEPSASNALIMHDVKAPVEYLRQKKIPDFKLILRSI